MDFFFSSVLPEILFTFLTWTDLIKWHTTNSQKRTECTTNGFFNQNKQNKLKNEVPTIN